MKFVGPLPVGDWLIQLKAVPLTTGVFVLGVSADPTRFGIIISGQPASTDLLQAFPGVPPTVTLGISFGGPQGNLIFNFRDHGAIVCGAWSLLRSVAASTATITELLYRPYGVDAMVTGLPEDLETL